MRVFAFEYFSGGGLAGQPLPASLAREGDLMLATLARDLAEVPGTTVLTSRDPRLPPLPDCENFLARPGEDPFALYARGLAAAEAAWPTGPERAGILERLCADTQSECRTLLGCRPAAVRVAASKRATARMLGACGVPVVPTMASGDVLPAVPGRWVVKPDDGAGCEGVEVVPDRATALERLTRKPDLVAQPWVDGAALSLSLLCADGTARLLCCNRQRIAVREGRVSLEAVVVDDYPDKEGWLCRLAGQIAAAIQGLWGYVGVDLVLTPAGPVVLEVNPRLTTSYCGLRAVLGINPAGLVLDLLGSSDPLTEPRSRVGPPVEIHLEPSPAA